MSEADVQIFARLSLFSFLLETMHANIFMNRPDPHQCLADFKVTITDRFRDATFRGNTSFDDAAIVQQASMEVIERFFQATAETLTQIQAQKERADVSQPNIDL
jgi:hypothetical protein